MATMTHRTSFSLDEGTTARIKSLAKLWKVSQAEVVRRAVSLAEMPADKVDAVTRLQKLHADGEGLPAKAAKAYLAEAREARRQWRSE
jgi:Arc/MetJ-type ribon-helix-helix transcriptional regulator